MKTGIIRYNLKDRGRTHRGVERNFNIPQIVASINSPATQERVRHRDMHGYYGHWPRIQFGMNPAEGGIVGGKAVAIDSAFVTTLLKAYPDGTVEHEAEFLDTASGIIAMRQFMSKVGGFSSAIIEKGAQFFGFDYVKEPNFSTNRGYEITLDSVSDSTGFVFDSVVEVPDDVRGVLMLLDSVTSAHMAALQTVATISDENDELREQIAAKDSPTLDALESVTANESGGRRFDSITSLIEGFASAEVAGMTPDKPHPKSEVEKGFAPVINRLLSRR